MTAIDPDSASPNLEAVGDALFQQLDLSFVQPELERRREADQPSDLPLTRFQVLMPPDGEPVVRLNTEVGGMATAAVDLSEGLEKGQEVYLHQITGISAYEPNAEDANIPHVTAFGHAKGWSIVFKLGWQHPERHERFERGKEFAITAREALAADRKFVFLDSAFSAVELFAKAELLSHAPTIQGALAARHDGIQQQYNAWGKLENTDQRFVKALNRLRDLRPAARYGDKPLVIEQAELNQLSAVLSEMEAAVQRMVNGAVCNSYNVIATRDLIAGQLISPDSAALTPPRQPRSNRPKDAKAPRDE